MEFPCRARARVLGLNLDQNPFLNRAPGILLLENMRPAGIKEPGTKQATVSINVLIEASFGCRQMIAGHVSLSGRILWD